ncbi:MAG: right-handed parallel beta-helix repeat-containing protein [Deltaproteobacteria bacterium]|nr:right-handed parallel beta-helix repeat-containing protein [Deltaproteobacteria bacterium]
MISDNHHPFSRSLNYLTAALLLLFVPACSSDDFTPKTCTINYWVATNGSDQAKGDSEDPFLTIEHVRDVIRENDHRGMCTLKVTIREGTYRLKGPLILGAEDSGASGAEVVYQAAPGERVLILGSQPVTGWTLHDADFNIWRAEISIDAMPRQLYVNGQRATRARTPEYPNYYTPAATGYTYEYVLGSDPQIPPTWKNPTAVEAVTVTQWKMMRCPVAEIHNDTEVIMETPCWDNANVFPYPWNFHLLSWWENAYEFLDEAGEWYLDPQTQTVYYIPREGEEMAGADVELPVLEKLVDAAGDVSEPVRFIRFKGLRFMYATWLGPNSSDGYALDQSGFHLKGWNHTANTIGHDPDAMGIPGNLDFCYAQHITFEDNVLAHMGAVALNFGTGSQNNAIANNSFMDISAAAIQVGGIGAEDHHPEYPSQLTRDNRIANNLIEKSGQEFYDAPGIFIGFTTRSIVEHNEISHVPWAGIAVGWGWGLLDPGGFAGLPNAIPYEWGYFDTPSAAQGNRIIHNKIQYFLEKLWDGGAIYTTGFQGTTMENGQLIAWNVATDKRPLAGGNTFYTDGGSRFVTLRQNVSLDNPQGFVDFGPCMKASSFEDLCLTTGIVPYGKDMGGCVPYGDLVFENNYLRDHLGFYNICTNSYYPSAPVNMTFENNVRVSTSSEVPAWILESAGRQ